MNYRAFTNDSLTMMYEAKLQSALIELEHIGGLRFD